MSKLYIYQIRVFIIDIACILRFVHGVGFIYIFPRTRVRLSSIALKSEINRRVGVAHLGTRIICRRFALWCRMLREIFPISSRGWKAPRKGKVHDTISLFVPFSSKNFMRINLDHAFSLQLVF